MAEAKKGGRSSAGKRSAKSGTKSRTSGKSRASGSRAAAGGAGKATAKAAARKPAAKKTTSGKPAAKKGTARKPAAKKAAARKPAAKKAGARRSAAKKAAAQREFSGKSAAELREALTKNLIRPLELMMLSRDRIQEVLDDAVDRGRMTRADATELVRGLVELGRKQTNDVLSDLEQLLGRGQEEARKRGGGARKQVTQASDRVRRAVGQRPSFPVSGYDDLSVAEVQKRLDPLTPAELRKVRDYERRNANRKSVLQAIERKLG